MKPPLSSFIKQEKHDKRLHAVVQAESSGGTPEEKRATAAAFVNLSNREGYEKALKKSQAYNEKSPIYRQAESGEFKSPIEAKDFEETSKIVDETIKDPNRPPYTNFVTTDSPAPYWESDMKPNPEVVGRQRYYEDKKDVPQRFNLSALNPLSVQTAEAATERPPIESFAKKPPIDSFIKKSENKSGSTLSNIAGAVKEVVTNKNALDEFLQGYGKDLTALPYRAFGVQAPEEGAFFSRTKAPVTESMKMLDENVVQPALNIASTPISDLNIPGVSRLAQAVSEADIPDLSLRNAQRLLTGKKTFDTSSGNLKPTLLDLGMLGALAAQTGASGINRIRYNRFLGKFLETERNAALFENEIASDLAVYESMVTEGKGLAGNLDPKARLNIVVDAVKKDPVASQRVAENLRMKLQGINPQKVIEAEVPQAKAPVQEVTGKVSDTIPDDMQTPPVKSDFQKFMDDNVRDPYGIDNSQRVAGPAPVEPPVKGRKWKASDGTDFYNVNYKDYLKRGFSKSLAEASALSDKKQYEKYLAEESQVEPPIKEKVVEGVIYQRKDTDERRLVRKIDGKWVTRWHVPGDDPNIETWAPLADEDISKVEKEVSSGVWSPFKESSIKGGLETPLPEAPKQPYLGVEPGSPQWKAVWDANPAMQQEMLAYRNKLDKNAKYSVMKKVIESIPEDSPFVEDFLARNKTSREAILGVINKLENDVPLSPEEGMVYNMFKKANIENLKVEIDNYERAIRENAAKEDLIRSGLPESEIQALIESAREKGRSRARTSTLGRRRKVRGAGEMTLDRALREKLITADEVAKIVTSFANNMFKNWQLKIKNQNWNRVLSEVVEIVTGEGENQKVLRISPVAQEMWVRGLTRAWNPNKSVEAGVKSVASSVLRSILTELSAPDTTKKSGENLIKYNKALDAIEKEGKIPTREEIQKRTKLTFEEIFFAELDNLAMESFEPGIEGNIEGNKTGRKVTKAPTDTVGFAKLKNTMPAMEENPISIEMPEMAQFYKALTDKPVLLKKLAKYWGYFKTGQVTLDPRIFSNPKFAAYVFAHEIGHLIDWLPDKTLTRGNVLGRLHVFSNFMKYEFMRDDGVPIKNEEVTEELKKLTMWWNPFDEKDAKHAAYRYSSRELYADFLSVVINNPEKAQAMAPLSWRIFWDELYKKPEVTEAFVELNDFLKMGPGEKFRVREAILREGHKPAEIRIMQSGKEADAARKNFWHHCKAEFMSKNIATLEYIKRLEKAGIKVNPEENPRYYMEEQNLIGGRFFNDVEDTYNAALKPLMDRGLTLDEAHSQIGNYMFMNWVITGRLDGEGKPISNPLGYTPKTAQDFLNGMYEKYGPEHMEVLKQCQQNLRAKYESMILEAAQLGMYSMDQLYGKPDKVTGLRSGGIMAQSYYAPIRILEYADKFVSSRIIEQKGASPTSYPVNSLTILTKKMLNLRREMMRQKVKLSIRDMYNLFPKTWVGEQLERVPAKSYSKYGPVFDRYRKPGKGMMIMYENGKKVAYYVDKEIERSLEEEPAFINEGVANVMNFLNSSFIRPVFTGWNLGFQTMHTIRMMWTAWLSTNATLGDILYWMYKTHRPAFQFAFKDMTPKLFYDMRESGLLGFRFNDMYGLKPYDDEGQMEYLTRRYRQLTEKKPWHYYLRHPWFFLANVGNYIEAMNRGTMTQIMKYTKAGKGFSPKEQAHLIRYFGGEPAMVDRGRLHAFTNNFSLFFNDLVQGTRGYVEASLIEPRTRVGFWWKWGLGIALPTIAIFLATLGFFGKKWKEIYDKQSEYKKANYINIPIGTTTDGKGILFLIPLDPISRILRGMFWKALNINKDNYAKQLAGINRLGLDALPGGSPIITIARAWMAYFSGGSPYDDRQMRDVLTQNEMQAGYNFPNALKYTTPKMVKWTLGQIGFSALTDEAKPRTSKIEIVGSDIPILARFIDVTDVGDREKERALKEKHYQYKAVKAVERNRARREMEKKSLNKK